MGIKWDKVEGSSQIRKIGMENVELPDTLFIEFYSGGIYSYDTKGDTEPMAEAIKNAISPGSYFATNVKNRYPYKRIS